MEKVQLEYLKEYVPFLDYLIQKKEQESEKFTQINKWITMNVSFTKPKADLMEKAIKAQYAKHVHNKLLPDWIHDIFRTDEISLLSDDEEETPAPPASPIPLMYPVVLLKKLSPALLKDLTNNKEITTTTPLQVELVQCKPQDIASNQFSLPAKVNHKKFEPHIYIINNDSKMTEQNTIVCVICRSKPRNLTNHFVAMHKCESYVSRLSQRSLAILRDNISYALLVKQYNVSKNDFKPPIYSIVCPFCESRIKHKFDDFYDHFASHTGEFAYYCSYCKLKKPFQRDISEHQTRSKLCRTSKICRLYIYSKNSSVIYIYRCNICNFVQLNAANVEKHIVDHHGSHYGSDTIEKLVVAALSESNSCLSNNNLAETLPEEETVTTFNAAESEDEECFDMLFNNDDDDDAELDIKLDIEEFENYVAVPFF